MLNRIVHWRDSQSTWQTEGLAASIWDDGRKRYVLRELFGQAGTWLVELNNEGGLTLAKFNRPIAVDKLQRTVVVIVN